VNDPDQTMRLPVVEVNGESNGTSSASAFPPQAPANGTSSASAFPPQAPAMSHSTIAADVDPLRSEPTVLGAVRRYRGMVVAVTLLVVAAAVGYSLAHPKVYRAQAFITMPQQASLQGQQANSSQNLDSQVLLLESQSVAQLAATSANATLHSNLLTTSDFYGPGSSLKISPPVTAAPGAYGATVIGVSFTASPAQVAEVGLNAVIQAYNQTRSAAIRSQANAAIAGIDSALGATNFQLAGLKAASSPYAQSLQQQLLAQRAALVNQQAQTIANEQIDLAQQPAVAIEPATTSNHEWALDGGIGLIIGILVGGALAFARDSRRRRKIAARQGPGREHDHPSRSYSGVPPLPASEPERWPAAASSPSPPEG
jgi:hypothetical protein